MGGPGACHTRRYNTLDMPRTCARVRRLEVNALAKLVVRIVSPPSCKHLANGRPKDVGLGGMSELP